MSTTWEPTGIGVLALPSGRLIRGRGLRRPPPLGPDPQFGVYLLGRRPADLPWDNRWVRWPDFWRQDAVHALTAAWRRATYERVKIACSGGIGRTGTGLACLATLDGLDARDAISYVRERYHPRAVETPWQRRLVERFPLESVQP